MYYIRSRDYIYSLDIHYVRQIQQSPDVTNNTYEEIIIGTNNEEKETTEDIVVVNGTSKEAQKSEVQISNNVYRIIGKAFVDMNFDNTSDCMLFPV